jgi:hypothetical protein
MDWVGSLWVQTRKVDYLQVSYIYLEYCAVYQIHQDNVSKTRNKNRIGPELIELEYEMEQLFQHTSPSKDLFITYAPPHSPSS